MNITSSLSDVAVLEEMGLRIAQRRLDLQLTQMKVAEQAGVSKRTLERIEAGFPAQTLSLIRILRVLELISNIEQMLPAATPSPMDYLKMKGKTRRRAPSATRVEEPKGKWSWDDDS